MADEVTVNGVLQYKDANGANEFFPPSPVDLFADAATLKVHKSIQSIGTSEEALSLGEVTAPGWFMAKNLDETNFIELRVATGGAKFAKLLPGETCGPIRLGSGAQAPYAIADTAACLLYYMMIST